MIRRKVYFTFIKIIHIYTLINKIEIDVKTI